MSSDIVINVKDLSKCYPIYDQPGDRLKQFILPRFQRSIGQQPKQYFKEFWALNAISFEVKRGESVGIIGRNGAGKSTLLQIITGVLAPTTGSVEVKGKVAALLELGSGFNPEFTGKENVYMSASILGLTSEEINAKYQNIIDFADIGEFIDQPVKTYSSGMMVRLAFAVQACIEPEVLIVDEALGVGDALFQKKCSARLHALKAKGVTLLFVSHDVFSVRQLCERALLVEKGCLISYGDSEAVTSDYYNLLFPPAAAQVDLVDPSDLAGPELCNTGGGKDKLQRPGSQQITVPDKISWGYGGVKLKSLVLRGGSIPGGFKEGDKLVIEMGYVCNAAHLKKLAKEHHVSPNLIFGCRLDTDKSIVVCDIVDQTVVGDDSIKETVDVIFSIFMPALKSGNYFFSLGVAIGKDSEIIPVASYDNIIMLRSEPTIQFVGLIDIEHSVERI